MVDKKSLKHRPEQHVLLDISDEIRGSTITFKDLEYRLITRKCCGCLGAKQEKVVLDKISGIFKSGMNGIMGPTGSGKTSLLDLIAGRKDPRFRQGMVLVDGKPQPSNFRNLSGYVQQQDVIYGSLTVLENLTFASNLRLPSSCSSSKRQQRVKTVIAELNLTDCVNTYIGNEYLRGVSGGEKKRTAIGMALINQPSVLFLDEPTTGLDANTASSVMKVLSRLSQMGRTVIFSIHQPRYSIFKLIDYLICLDQGKVVYQGSRNEVIPYFDGFGYQLETNNNPADFLLDIITGDEKSSNPMNDNLTNNFVHSKQWEQIKIEVDDVFNSTNSLPNGTVSIYDSKMQFNASFGKQIVTLSYRSLLNIARNPAALLGQIFVTFFIGLVIGGIYYQIDDSYKTGIFNRMGVFFFITVNLMFSNMSALEVFLNDRIMFINENATGYYRTSTFFLTKLIFDVLLMRFIPVIFLGCVTYWMIGLDSDPSKFGLFLLNMMLGTICAAAIVLFASASFSTLAICNLMGSLSFVIMMIFSGMLINTTSIGPVFAWLKYISVVRYTLTIFLINELKDKEYCSTFGNRTMCQSGNQYLADQGISYETNWDFWYNYLINFVIYLVIISVTYIQLRRINKYK